MPKLTEHEERVIRNFHFSEKMEKLDKNPHDFPEWQIVCWFYECLHAIEKLFISTEIAISHRHASNHDDRYRLLTELINKAPRNDRRAYRQIRSCYKTLSSLAHSARYKSIEEFNNLFKQKERFLPQIVNPIIATCMETTVYNPII